MMKDFLFAWAEALVHAFGVLVLFGATLAIPAVIYLIYYWVRLVIKGDK